MSDDESTTRGCSVSEAGQGSPSLPTDAATDSEDNEAVRHRHGDDVHSTRSSSGGSEDLPVVRKRCSFMMADVLASRSPPPQQLPLHPPDNSLSILKSIQRIVENHAKLLQSPLDRRKDFSMIGHHLQSSESESGSDFPPRSNSPPCPPPAHQAALLPSAALNFSIDNILRPDFRLASRIAQLRAFQAAAAAAAAAAAVSSTDRCCAEPVDLRRARKPSQQLQQPASTAPGSAAASRQPPASPTQQHPPLPASNQNKWPAWVYCTRYSDRPSSGPRIRKVKKRKTAEEKRPRTAFTSDQLARLKVEFQQNRYLTEKRRQDLANELGLNESQIKIWFQNKRAKLKKSVGVRNPLAMSLMTEGLYNHATVAIEDDDC